MWWGCASLDPPYLFTHFDHKYLLRPLGELVDRVREKLESLQQTRNQFRALRAMEREVRRSLRLEKAHLQTLLRPYGLWMKGFEVRGWRCCTFRSFLPRRRGFFSKISLPSLKRFGGLPRFLRQNAGKMGLSPSLPSNLIEH
jgi:hypothetical protein